MYMISPVTHIPALGPALSVDRPLGESPFRIDYITLTLNLAIRYNNC